LVFEWWAFEFVLLAAGLLKDPDVTLAAMGISFQITALLYMIPLGFGGAISTRVANELGANNPRQARTAALLIASVIVLNQALFATLLLTQRRRLPMIFTNDPRVIAMTNRVLVPLSFSIFGDGLQCVLSGLLRGAGRPELGAAFSMVSYWLVGLPLAWYFGFHRGLGAPGLWIGLACTTNLQGLVVSVVVALIIDWKKEAQNAARLLAEAGVGAEDSLAHHVGRQDERGHL